jgi:hypothetical protein
MSKTKTIILIAIILSIALGVASGIYFYSKKIPATTQPTPSDKTIFGGGGGVRTDLPTDNTNNPQVNSDGSGTDRPLATSTPKTSPLRMIALGPIAGGDFVTRDIIATSSLIISTSSQSIGTSTSKTKNLVKAVKPKILGQEEKIRYIERGTGRIYETASSTLTTSRITNSTLTRITESFFDKAGSSLLIRGLVGNSDVIQTALGTTLFETATSTSMSLQIKTLPYNLLSVVTSPEKDYFASYIEQKGVGSSINISRLDGTGVSNIYKSPFREWLLSWPTKDTVILNTKPSAYSSGFAYSINTGTKSFKRLTGGQNGLTTLVSPDGLNVLIGESIEGSMKLSVLNLKTQTYKDIYTRTMPEKCVWSKIEKNIIFCAASESIVYAPYPDAWYQGLVFFDDNVWKINIDTQENKVVAIIKDYMKNGLDSINLTLNKNEDYMLFTNKKDLSLWGLVIDKPQKVATSTTSSAKNTTKTQQATTTSTKTTTTPGATTVKPLVIKTNTSTTTAKTTAVPAPASTTATTTTSTSTTKKFID